MDLMQDASKCDRAFRLRGMYSYELTVPHSVAM